MDIGCQKEFFNLHLSHSLLCFHPAHVFLSWRALSLHFEQSWPQNWTTFSCENVRLSRMNKRIRLSCCSLDQYLTVSGASRLQWPSLLGACKFILSACPKPFTISSIFYNAHVRDTFGKTKSYNNKMKHSLVWKIERRDWAEKRVQNKLICGFLLELLKFPSPSDFFRSNRSQSPRNASKHANWIGSVSSSLSFDLQKSARGKELAKIQKWGAKPKLERV